jgi:hexosaminidase
MKIRALLLSIVASATSIAAPRTAVTWQSLGHQKDEQGLYFVQRFTITGDTDFDKLAFNEFARKMYCANPLDTITEIVPGYYSISSPRFSSGADSIVVDVITRSRLFNSNYAPDGVHRVNHDATTESVDWTRALITSPDVWGTPDSDPMPYGPTIYDLNASRSEQFTPGVYDIIPQFKKVTLTGGNSVVDGITYRDITNKNPEYYRMIVANDSLVVECAPQLRNRLTYTIYTKILEPEQLRTGNKSRAVSLPNAVIENWPDHEWRGLMIDVARNFIPVEKMWVIAQIMASNQLNRLHFHLVDDEAWRLEIPGLPELTEVGSRRGYANDESDHLFQIFCGDGNPDSQSSTSNGYVTRQDFIKFITMAHAIGIDVVPEIESPGHARAAIKAMEKRHRNGDDTYRLIHDNDSSTYTSAQSFHDNVMNPALPGPYKFMDKIFDEVIKMYQEAGVPLVAIHIGGDEVPKGAWSGSSAAIDFMKEHGMTEEKQLHAYFVRELAKSLNERGVMMNGWQEIAIGHDDKYNAEVSPMTLGVNCWSTIGQNSGAAGKVIDAGFNAILSNVDHLYFDLSYSGHPEEKGLIWGGYVDEFAALDAYPEKLCEVSENAKGRILGLNAQIFSETIRSFEQLMTYIIPKIYGLSERAWNSKPTWTESQFNSILGTRELPYMTYSGINVHLRQPGIKIIKGKAHMNAPYQGGEIRYTTDGTEPNKYSPLYTAPFKAKPGDDIRARYYNFDTESVTTYMPQQ